MTVITSTTNPLFKRIRKLEQRKFRKKEGGGFIDGLRGVLTAAERAPHLIEKVILAPDLLTGKEALSRLHSLIPPNKIIEFSADLFRALSDRDNPAGMGAIVGSPMIALADFPPPSPASRYLILERIADPGNLGTMIRTADGAGFDGVLLLGSGVDVLHPTASKASLGTLFTMQIGHTTADELAQWALNENIHLVGTSAKAEIDYANIVRDGPLGLLLGNEQKGLSAELAELANQTVTIPMHGQATSLNVAVAAGILMYSLRQSH